MTIKEVNKKVKEVMDMPPLIDYTEETKANVDQSAMNVALATMFVSKDFRNYLQVNINHAIKSLLRCEDMSDIYFAKGRILTLKEILIKAKRAFEGMEALKAKIKK